MKINLTFQGEPMAVQSVRFAKIGEFMRKYQPKKVGDWKNYVKMQAQNQLPAGFAMFTGPLRIEVDFVFPPLESWPARIRKAFASGATVRKITKPDLTDNLMKGLIDALAGIVWARDQQICEVSSRKIFGKRPETRMTVITLDEIYQPEWEMFGNEKQPELFAR